MENLDLLQKAQDQIEFNFEKGSIDESTFTNAMEAVTLIKGGKKAFIGEIRTFGGRPYIKTADGWAFHGKGTGAKAQAHKAKADAHGTQVSLDGGKTYKNFDTGGKSSLVEASETKGSLKGGMSYLGGDGSGDHFVKQHGGNIVKYTTNEMKTSQGFSNRSQIDSLQTIDGAKIPNSKNELVGIDHQGNHFIKNSIGNVTKFTKDEAHRDFGKNNITQAAIQHHTDNANNVSKTQRPGQASPEWQKKRTSRES